MLTITVLGRQMEPAYGELGLTLDRAAETVRFIVPTPRAGVFAETGAAAQVVWIAPDGASGEDTLALSSETAGLQGDWTPPSGAMQTRGVLRAELRVSVPGAAAADPDTVVWHSMPLRLRVLDSLEGVQAGMAVVPKWKTVTVDVTALPAGQDATGSVAQDANSIDFSFGIPAVKGDRGEAGSAGPAGADGADGSDGADGADGVSPTVTTSKTGKVSTITITDADGPHIVTIQDGADGSGTGDMLRATYDADADGVVDDAEMLGGQLPAYYAKASDLAGKVDKAAGKGLSENDYTSAEKTKLSGIEAGANAYEHPATHPATMITGLSGVATSGAYADLTGRPTIPAVDAAITSGSVNAAQSGAVFTALSGKQGTITASTTDLTAGTSPLATGEVYLVYE